MSIKVQGISQETICGQSVKQLPANQLRENQLPTNQLSTNKKCSYNLYKKCLYKKLAQVVSLLTSVSLVATPAFAQELGFDSELGLSVQQDSNIYRAADEVDDTIIVLAPQLVYGSEYGKHAYGLKYSGNYARFQNNSSLNYFEHDLVASAQLKHKGKLSSAFSLSYKDGIEQPGINNAQQLVLEEFNKQNTKNMSATLFYGTKQSIGQLVGKYTHQQLEFTNNGQEFRDFNRNAFTGTFLYRVAPKTRLLFEASVAELDSPNTQFVDFSRNQKSYLAGVEWNATAITSSVFKIGYQDVDFDAENLVDLSGLSYFLDMTWKPNTYTSVKIGASRAASESAEQSVGGFIRSGYGVDLVHELTSKTKGSIGYKRTNFDFAGSQNRKDELKRLVARLSFESKHWLQLYTEYENSKRSSAFELLQFNANIITIGANAEF